MSQTGCLDALGAPIDADLDVGTVVVFHHIGKQRRAQVARGQIKGPAAEAAQILRGVHLAKEDGHRE